MKSAFNRFPPRLQDAIVFCVDWSSLRPVQELASHALLNGNNAMILAPTAAFCPKITIASIFKPDSQRQNW